VAQKAFLFKLGGPSIGPGGIKRVKWHIRLPTSVIVSLGGLTEIGTTMAGFGQSVGLSYSLLIAGDWT
jgi:hypothetical protein